MTRFSRAALSCLRVTRSSVNVSMPTAPSSSAAATVYGSEPPFQPRAWSRGRRPQSQAYRCASSRSLHGSPCAPQLEGRGDSEVRRIFRREELDGHAGIDEANRLSELEHTCDRSASERTCARSRGVLRGSPDAPGPALRRNAASRPPAATSPQCVHFTIEPVFADSPPQREAAMPSARRAAPRLEECEAATVEPITPTMPACDGNAPRSWLEASSTRPCIRTLSRTPSDVTAAARTASPSASATGKTATPHVSADSTSARNPAVHRAALAYAAARAQSETEARHRCVFAAADRAHVLGDQSGRLLATSATATAMPSRSGVWRQRLRVRRARHGRGG